MECLLYVAMIVIAGIVYLNDYTDYKDSGGTAVVESNLKRNHHKVPRYGWGTSICCASSRVGDMTNSPTPSL